MTPPTGTFETFSAVGNREDLQDKIYDISPTDAPFMANGGTTTAKSTKHEWQTDALANATTDNAQIEGDDVGGSTSSPTTRLENYCQISRKDVVISNTQEVVDKAGRSSEINYQLLKRGRELRRDMETILVQNQGYAVGSSTVPRKLRSLESWLSTNVNRNTDTTSATTPGANAAGGTVGATDASALRAFSETILKNVIQKCFNSGGEPTILMVGPVNKQRVSGFAGRTAAVNQIMVADKIQAAAHLYASDFGNFKVIPNRFQRERSAFVLDPEFYAVSYLRRIQRKDLATTGDAMKKFLVVEYTLEMRNEKAHGVAADLTTT